MKDKGFDTGKLFDRILICEDLEEFRQNILDSVVSQQIMWKEKIKEIIEENNYTKVQLAKLCGVSRITVNGWCSGAVPKQRETFIRIGFAARYDLSKMNILLTRYGRYPELYPKSLEDSVCIFVLSSKEMPHTYERYQMILNTIKIKMNIENTKTAYIHETKEALNKILELSTEQEFKEFADKNAYIYKNQYNKLYAYIEAFLRVNKYIEADNASRSTHFLANGQQWSSSLRQCVSAIHQKKWYPMRTKIISLGLHLNMDTDQINEMLKHAHMESLYAKNPFESAIIYALENAKLEDMIFCDGTDTLCIYVKNILKELQIPDTEFFLDELPNEE